MMRRKTLTTAGLCVAVTCLTWILPGCLTTSGTTISGDAVHADEDVQVRIAFSDHDRSTIKRYYRTRRSELPPGLAKKTELPPGLRKQIQRNGQLPPGLNGDRLPGDLERRLEKLPADYVRIRVGADIVLMNDKTGVIVDVVEDIPI